MLCACVAWAHVFCMPACVKVSIDLCSARKPILIVHTAMASSSMDRDEGQPSSVTWLALLSATPLGFSGIHAAKRYVFFDFWVYICLLLAWMQINLQNCVHILFVCMVISFNYTLRVSLASI